MGMPLPRVPPQAQPPRSDRSVHRSSATKNAIVTNAYKAKKVISAAMAYSLR